MQMQIKTSVLNVIESAVVWVVFNNVKRWQKLGKDIVFTKRERKTINYTANMKHWHIELYSILKRAFLYYPIANRSQN